MAQDAAQIKEKIVSILKLKGPVIPIQIAHETNLSILFASAFLSELFGEKRIKMSTMRIGSSPLYFLPGQEPSLEKFSSHLKSKEKDAYLLLKEKKYLKDSELEPAIRVALRAIKDFAIPFKNNEEIYWRFLTTSEEEIKNIFEEKQRLKEEIKENEEVLEIAPVLHKEKKASKRFKEKTKRKKKENRQDGKFFERIKSFLSEKAIEIIGIESVNKDSLMFRIKEDGEEKLIVAYNKKRITDSDIINAYKKSKEMNLSYQILSLGEPSKKLSSLVEAMKKLGEIGKID